MNISQIRSISGIEDEARPAACRKLLKRANLISNILRKYTTEIGLDIGVGRGSLLKVLMHLAPEIKWNKVDAPSVSNSLFDDVKPVDLIKDTLPYPDKSFDVITICEVIEHLPDGCLLHLFMEMKRVLKNDGVIIVSVPNMTSLLNRLLWLFGYNIIKPPIPDKRFAGEVYPHINLYTAANYNALLKHIGMELKSYRYYSALPVAYFRGKLLNDLMVRLYMILVRTLGLLIPSLLDDLVLEIGHQREIS